MTSRHSLLALVATLATGCSASHTPVDDAGAPELDARDRSDAGPVMTRDSGSDGGIDGGLEVASDGGLDGGIDGGIDRPDAGRCNCGEDVCGWSQFCDGFCGFCPDGFYCARGFCQDVAVPPPGELCVDAFGENVIEGRRSVRVCPDDPALLQTCQCSGGGRDAWIGCGPCRDVQLDGARGARCATASQCADPLPCDSFTHICGETCERDEPARCPAGTACWIPIDVEGVCLATCGVCGTSCDDATTCRGVGALVCAPIGYPFWTPGCS